MHVVATFNSPADLFEAMFGPEQHDAHVHKRNAAKWLDAEVEGRKRGSIAIDEFLADERERQAQRVAHDYNYNTAMIRQALHRWEAGPFSHPSYAGIRIARIRQLTRALDIACERCVMAEAAE